MKPLLRPQVMHIRNYNGQKTLFTDPTMLKGWHDVFDTDDKQVVEEELRSSGQDYSWQKNDGLRIINTDQAVEKHPETGKKVWFNHSQVSERGNGVLTAFMKYCALQKENML